MLLSISLVFGMLIVWLVVTAAFFVVWIYKAVLGLREEDSLFIDPGEESQRRDQKEMFAKMDRIRPIFLGTLIASLALGFVTFGLWVYQQLQ